MTSQDDFDPRMYRPTKGRYQHHDPPTGQPVDVDVLYATPIEDARGATGPGSTRTYAYSDARSRREPRRPNPADRQRDAYARSKDKEEFDRLCQEIGQGVSQVSEALARGLSGAGGAIGEVIGQAVEGYRANQTRSREQAELARRQMEIDARFGKIGSLRTSGFIRCVIGGMTTFSFGTALVGTLTMSAVQGMPSYLIGAAIVGTLFALSATVLSGGIKRIKEADQMKALKRIMGPREAVTITEIARMTGQKLKKVLGAIQRLIAEGRLPQGHLDAEQTTLMVTDEAYRHYLALRESERARRMGENAQRTGAAAPPTGGPVIASDDLPPKVAAFLRSGNAYLEQFRQLDLGISDEAVSQRIVRIEDIVGRILARAKEEPAVIDQLGRFADYYLPTTVKLLTAYDALEEQTVQGDNIESSRREIESTLDVLLQAYEKLLDATFADLSMNVSSEISVLNTVLAQEGLTRSPFDAIPDDRKE